MAAGEDDPGVAAPSDGGQADGARVLAAQLLVWQVPHHRGKGRFQRALPLIFNNSRCACCRCHRLSGTVKCSGGRQRHQYDRAPTHIATDRTGNPPLPVAGASAFPPQFTAPAAADGPGSAGCAGDEDLLRGHCQALLPLDGWCSMHRPNLSHV